MSNLQERPFSQTQLFCSNLPWSVNGKMLRQSFEVHGEVVVSRQLSTTKGQPETEANQGV